MEIGGQDHMYLEGHIAFAIPGEDDEIVIHCSTQHPSEAQHMVAHVMGVPSNAVTVNVRRMGGGFGGKESQMNLSVPLPRWPPNVEQSSQNPARTAIRT